MMLLSVYTRKSRPQLARTPACAARWNSTSAERTSSRIACALGDSADARSKRLHSRKAKRGWPSRPLKVVLLVRTRVVVLEGIDSHNTPAVSDKTITQAGPDESRGAGNDCGPIRGPDDPLRRPGVTAHDTPPRHLMANLPETTGDQHDRTHRGRPGGSHRRSSPPRTENLLRPSRRPPARPETRCHSPGAAGREREHRHLAMESQDRSLRRPLSLGCLRCRYTPPATRGPCTP